MLQDSPPILSYTQANLTVEPEFSGSGKTQFLLSLCLAVQLPKPQGLQRRAIYISTEHPLSTPRLSQLLESHPVLSSLSQEQTPSLEAILSINAMDLETQDHILNFQLPVAIERYDIGLVVIDSITSNYRAEHSNNVTSLAKRARQLAKTGHLLRNLAIKENIAIVLANQVSDRFEPIGGASLPRPPFPSRLSQTAGPGNGPGSPYPKSRTEQMAAGRRPPNSQTPRSSQAISSSPYHAPNDKNFDGSYLIPGPTRSPFLTLAYQQRFFSGWGDGPNPESVSLKNPALGFVWSTKIACRIALKKEVSHIAIPPADWEYPPSQTQTRADIDQDPDSIAMPPPKHTAPGSQSQLLLSNPDSATRRIMKLVYCPWAGGLKDAPKKTRSSSRRTDEVEFEIWKGGLRSTSRAE
jgi:DNA repair protein RAD57